MKRLAAAALVLALAGCAATPRDRTDLRPTANPSAVIAAEMAFARAAQEKGQWTAFRQYATRDAVMFVPGQVNAQDWLRRQADPAQAVTWQPYQVWSSCDGSFVVSTGGATYPGGAQSNFLTVWQKQNDGKYLWVLDQALPHAERPFAADTIGAEVADCPASRPGGRIEARRGENWRSGVSNDRTLEWTTQVSADCSRVVTVRMAQGGALKEVFRVNAPSPGATASCV
jgi:hypothetical protein